MGMRESILWLVGRKEMDELWRWRFECQEYQKWLSYEFPEVGAALHNLDQQVRGAGLAVQYSQSHDGPYTISALREMLRAKFKRQAME